jgi:hypothetical protein
VVERVIDERLRVAIGSLISAVTTLAEEFFIRVVPVVTHGYGNPVPDGRGFLGGFWFLPGPWLKPGFSEKGYDSLERCSKIMEDLGRRQTTPAPTATTGPNSGESLAKSGQFTCQTRPDRSLVTNTIE